jgi:hypothetical protein
MVHVRTTGRSKEHHAESKMTGYNRGISVALVVVLLLVH